MMLNRTPIHISRSEWALLLTLAAVQFSHILDFVLMIPLGPQAMRELQIGPKDFGLLVSSYGFAAFFSSLLAALVLDQFDRKRSMLFLYVGFSVSTLGCGIAPDYPSFLAARIAAGAFGGVLSVAVLAIVGDVFADERRGTATGVIMSAFAIASIMGVPLGLLAAQSFGFGAPFLLLTGFSVLVMFGSALVLPRMDQHVETAHPPGIRAFVHLLREPNHQRAYLFMVMLVFSTFLVVPYIGAYLVGNAGRAEQDLPLVYFCAGSCTLVSMNLVGRASDRIGKLPVFRLMMIASIAMTLVLTNLPGVTLAIAILVATGYMVANSGRMVPAMALVTASASPKIRGGFLSLNTAVQHLAQGLASLAAGLLMSEREGGRLDGYSLVGAMAALAGLLSIYLAGRLRSGETVVVASGPAQPIPVSAME